VRETLLEQLSVEDVKVKISDQRRKEQGSSKTFLTSKTLTILLLEFFKRKSKVVASLGAQVLRFICGGPGGI